MLNKKILIGAVVGILVLGWFLFLKPQEVKSPSVNTVEIEKEIPRTDSVVKKQEQKQKQEEIVSEINIEDIKGKAVYYYSLTCGHCKGVNEFLEKNDIVSKIGLIKKEVSQSAENGKELGEVAQKCGINPGRIGVPFLFADGKCYVGGPKIEGFFNRIIGL